MNGAADRELRGPWISILCLALVVGIALRAYCLFTAQGFWFDDIYAATFANLSLWETVTAVLRFDVHPPLYYLQIDVWSWIFGHSDRALQLNTVVWSCAALFVLFLGSRRRFGLATALAAVALAAVMGCDLFFAPMLRTYSMVSCLCLWAWIEAGELSKRPRARDSWLLMLLLALIGCCHSAGVVPASSVLLFCAPDFSAPDWKLKFKTWFKVCVIVGLALLPWVVLGMFRHAAAMSTASWPIVSHTIGGWPLGYDYDLPEQWREYASIAVLILLAACYALVPSARRLVLCLILWPMLFVAMFSAIAKPIWYYRPLSFISPFAAIAVAALVGRLVELSASRKRWLPFAPVVALVAVVGLLCWIDYQQLSRAAPTEFDVTGYRVRDVEGRQDARPGWPSEFLQISDYLRGHVQADELVYVPDYRTFWGVARYLAGPQWGNAGEVQDPLDQDHSPRWPNIYRKIGPQWLAWLHLAPRTRRVDGFRAPLFIGWSPLDELNTHRSFWEVEPIIKEEGFAVAETSTCVNRRVDTVSFAGTRVFHIICAEQTPAGG